MDSSALLRRTPAGDSEVAIPANGLSLTQRRILTLLDTPVRLSDLPVGPAVDPVRLEREALRLAQAGLVAWGAGATSPVAANARFPERVHPGPVPLGRPLAAMLAAVAVLVLTWAGWRLAADPPSAGENGRTVSRATGNRSVASQPAPDATPDPPVIATRVLRGDPSSRNRDAAKESSASPQSKTLSPSGADAGRPDSPSATSLPRAASTSEPEAAHPVTSSDR